MAEGREVDYRVARREYNEMRLRQAVEAMRAKCEAIARGFKFNHAQPDIVDAITDAIAALRRTDNRTI